MSLLTDEHSWRIISNIVDKSIEIPQTEKQEKKKGVKNKKEQKILDLLRQHQWTNKCVTGNSQGERKQGRRNILKDDT